MIARDVTCPTCNATARQPCRSLISRHAGKAHAAREGAAVAATKALAAAGLGDFSAAKARRRRTDAHGRADGSSAMTARRLGTDSWFTPIDGGYEDMDWSLARCRYVNGGVLVLESPDPADEPMPDQVDTTIDPWTRMLGDCRGYPRSVHQTSDDAQRAANAFASLREREIENSASLNSRPARRRRKDARDARTRNH